MEEIEDDKSARTLLPRFSMRTLFWLVTGSAFVFVVVGMATRGAPWALGVSIAVLSLVVTLLMHAAWFFAVSVFGRVTSPRTKDGQ
jgi:hypothetical protein